MESTPGPVFRSVSVCLDQGNLERRHWGQGGRERNQRLFHVGHFCVETNCKSLHNVVIKIGVLGKDDGKKMHRL